MQANICRFLGGLSLLVAIGIPSFVPALHELFHYHSHLHCTATSTDVHLHADVYDCDLCDYLISLSFFHDRTTTKWEDRQTAHVSPLEPHDEAILLYQTVPHLRGPPPVA